jgi:hypothetical protein
VAYAIGSLAFALAEAEGVAMDDFGWRRLGR